MPFVGKMEGGKKGEKGRHRIRDIETKIRRFSLLTTLKGSFLNVMIELVIFCNFTKLCANICHLKILIY